MANRVAFLWMAGGAMLCLAAGCEEEENKVPESVWAAAMARCERLEECDGSWFASRYSSVEECADIKTKSLSWDNYSQECIESWIAVFECEASAPCFPSNGHCSVQYRLNSYLCYRLDTAKWGLMCGTAEDWDDCDAACPDRYLYIVAWCLCSAETPDYCNCGAEQCAQGEYCCYCEPQL